MLKDEFKLDLVATDCSDVGEYFDDFDKYTFDGDSKIAEVRGLYNYLKNNETDAVVQVTEPTQHGWIAGLLSTYAGCKYIYRYDTDAFYSYKPREGLEKAKYFGLHNVLGRLPLKLADRHIVLGPTGKERLKKLGVKENQISILPPTINPERIESSTSGTDLNLNHIEQENVVLFIGRLNRMKGFYFLMDKIQDIIEKRNDIHFLIIGNGNQPTISDKLEKHVTFTGFVPPSEIGKYLDVGDALVIPSLREGLPRVLLEAKSSNLTIIARDVGEIKSATDNIFFSDSDFVDMVCSFENLPKDLGKEYHREDSLEEHVREFRKIINQH